MKKQHLDTSILHIASVIILIIVLSVSNLFAGSVTASWKANSEPDIAGYKLFIGKVSGVYSDSIDVGNTTAIEVNDLDDRSKYFFAVTAYDSTGNESSFSNEVSKMVGKNLIGPGNGGNDGDWEIVPVDSATEFIVYKSKNPYSTFSDTLLGPLGQNETTFVDHEKDSTINTGTYYKVKAKKNGQDYYEYPTVGEYHIGLKRNMTLVSLPLVPGDSSLATILKDQLTGGNQSASADKIHVYNTQTGEYESAWLFAGGGDMNGKWISGSGSEESHIKIKPHEAFWIELAPFSTDTILTITGIVPQDTSTTIELLPGYNFIGAPFPVQVKLDSSDLVKDGVMVGSGFSANADMLIEWKDTKTFKRAWLFSKAGSNYNGKFMNEDGAGISEMSFQPGNGYVIWKKNQSNNNIWTLPNPHPNVDDN